MLAIATAAVAAGACGSSGASAPSSPPRSAASAAPFQYPPPPAGTTLRIISPADGESVAAGRVYVRVAVTGARLAFSGAPDVYHVHVFLDKDPSEFVGTDKVLGLDPLVLHTIDSEVYFDGVAPGPHTVVVFLSYVDHSSVRPPIVQRVSFVAR